MKAEYIIGIPKNSIKLLIVVLYFLFIYSVVYSVIMIIASYSVIMIIATV